MDRLQAFRALFGTNPETATQAHVNWLKGLTTPTDEENGKLGDEIVASVNKYLDDPESYAEDEPHAGRSALLKALASKATFTPIMTSNLHESVEVGTPLQELVEEDPPPAQLRAPLRFGSWADAFKDDPPYVEPVVTTPPTSHPKANPVDPLGRKVIGPTKVHDPANAPKAGAPDPVAIIWTVVQAAAVLMVLGTICAYFLISRFHNQ